MAYFFFLLIAAIWGSSFILMKKAALAFSPLDIGAGRVVGGALVLGLMSLWRQRGWALRRQDAAPLLFVVLVGFVWPFTIQPYLVSLHGSAFIAMTVSFVPLMTILASVPILGVYPTRRQTIGVLGALACMALLMRDGLDRSVPVWDLCLAISVPACYAVVNTWIRRSLSHVPSLALAAASLGLASGVLLPLSIWNSQAGLSQTDQWPLAWAALACLGVLGTGLAQVLFNKLIQDQGPLFAGMVTNLVPVGAVLWGWSDHEQVTALQLAALVGILAMVTFVQYGAAARRPPPRAPRPEPPRDSNEAQARG